jgi:hypothetical protein
MTNAYNVEFSSASPGLWPNNHAPGNVSSALDALAAAISAGNGGQGNVKFANRFDLSVNHARIENATSSAPTFVIPTSGPNPAGGFNGGGTGNKGILGFKEHGGLPVGGFQSVSFEYQFNSLTTVTFVPFFNMVVDITGTGGYRIFVIDPSVAVSLNTGTITPLGGGKFRFTHNTATNYVQVVNAFTAYPGPTPPASPAVSPPVPIAMGTGPSWQGASFRYSDILASYPASILVDANSLDGGLPNASITPALMIIMADSNNLSPYNVTIQNVLFNGSPA